MTSGFIYCLSNPSMPGLVKIGLTRRTVEERAKELYTSGVPTPFVIEAYYESNHIITAEEHIHDMLDLFRVSSSREFFRIKVDSAKAILGAYFSEMTEADYDNNKEDCNTDPVDHDIDVSKSSHPTIRTVLEEAYVIDIDNTDKDNYCTSRELIDYIKGTHTKFSSLSDTKLGRELRKIGLLKIKKKLDHKCVSVCYGIRPTGISNGH